VSENASPTDGRKTLEGKGEWKEGEEGKDGKRKRKNGREIDETNEVKHLDNGRGEKQKIQNK
jgi:hypothetical protein